MGDDAQQFLSARGACDIKYVRLSSLTYILAGG